MGAMVVMMADETKSLDLGGTRNKKPACQCRKHRLDPWVGKIPWRMAWKPTPAFLPGESHGQKSLVGYSLYGMQIVRHN